MKIILLLCKSNYRKNNLNNFYHTYFFGKYLMISFSGIFYYLGLLLKSLKFIKVISIDSEPSISTKKGFNFWLTGTIHKIPNNFIQLENNFVNMKSVFHDKDKIFQIYPIIKKNKVSEKKTQIVYFSNCKIKKPKLSLTVINKYKNEIKKNLLLFDDKNFWVNNNFKEISEIDKFLIYRDLKINQRIEIIRDIMNEFLEDFLLFGDEWKMYFSNSQKTTMEKKKIQMLYNGNICLDFGSASGSLSLYPRSIDIIESGGYLLQLKQADSEEIFHEYGDFFTFKNTEELKEKIRILINDKPLFNSRLKLLHENFKSSKLLIEKQLNKCL